jgi:hypothetical protein
MCEIARTSQALFKAYVDLGFSVRKTFTFS